MLNRRHYAAVGLAASVLLAGCGSEPSPRGARPSAAPTSLEPATQRGLAAAVMAHLDPAEIEGVSGSDDGTWLLASVALSDPNLSSVIVIVSDPLPGSRACGGDDGYVRIDCTPGPPFAEVVQQRQSRGRGPVYIARAQSDDRAHVLIEIFGRPSKSGLALARALVADPHVGEITTATLNQVGEEIEDFGESEIERSITDVESR